MEQDPFAGDVLPLKNERTAFRRRLGDWRIFFDADRESRIVEVGTGQTLSERVPS